MLQVTFKLHESYTTQTRVVTRPPYEVTETGWGEFEIAIKVFFHDPNERPVSQIRNLAIFLFFKFAMKIFSKYSRQKIPTSRLLHHKKIL